MFETIRELKMFIESALEMPVPTKLSSLIQTRISKRMILFPSAVLEQIIDNACLVLSNFIHDSKSVCL
jgi:hypothetical protein